MKFISKINDRNLQRKRESGLTGYVLISALVICFYKLFTHFEYLLNNSIYATENFTKSIELVFYTFNVMISSAVVINVLFPTLKTLNSIKVLKPVKIENYVIFSMTLTYFLNTILLIYVLLTIQISPNGFYFYCFLIFLLTFFGWSALYQILKSNKSKELKIEKEQIKLKNIILALTIIVSLIVSICSINYIYNLSIDYKSEMIKIVALLYISFVVIERILMINTNDLFYSKLEDFEYEIELRKLTEEEVRREFQERFSGFLVNDYMEHQMKLAEYRLLTFKENIENINSQIIELRENIGAKSADLISDKENEKIVHFKSYKESCGNQLRKLEISLANNISEFDQFEKEQLFKLINILKEERKN